MKQDKEYWRKRCELAENVIYTSGIVGGWPFVKWENYVNHKSNILWYDAPPPPPHIPAITASVKNGSQNTNDN